MQQYQRVFREFIHGWMGGDSTSGLRAELMATCVITAHNYVLRRWLRGLTEQPEAEFDTAMADVIELFADASANGPAEGEASIVILRTTGQLDAMIPSLRKFLASSEPAG